MEAYQAVLLGVVEGLTEFLPISSTGHLILTSHIMGIPQDSFTKSFEISIQMGAIMAVLFLYWRRIVKNPQLWKRIIVAFFPTGVLGFLLYKLVKNYLIGNDLVTSLALIGGGLFLLVADRVCSKFCYIRNVEDLPLLRAFAIGVFQALAMVPGVSRSGATIIGGMLMGLNRKAATEFSFLLAIPTMMAATSYDLYKSHHNFQWQEWHLLLLGFVSAFLSALLAVKVFLRFVSSHSFVPFGVYRILVGALYLSIFYL
ncbi:undecaprenol kinase [Thermocrinis albus DSM 14484]|uniref:Undecaprenyl-diphosphatase n=1 Tax=Thermocrinis albus (strain DSM 14484 / JCM 11386 / HI 11/12) TaxID=638303 RepID=D3SLI8_THEAH|nr:undecaprenyl-diphosphate phosphatase [Thermocrinis albus]ADC89618.1 undecaprenol kinase [Thermocrinis albus DSM 14484]